MDDVIPAVRLIVKTADGERVVWSIGVGNSFTAPAAVTVLAVEYMPGWWRWDDEEGRQAVEWLESGDVEPRELLKDER
jgi:hypothetical protein